MMIVLAMKMMMNMMMITNIEVCHHAIAAQSLLLLPSRVLVKRPRYFIGRPAQYLHLDFPGFQLSL